MGDQYREQIIPNKDMLSGAKSHISNTSPQKLETPLPTVGGTVNNNSHNPSVSHINQNHNISNNNYNNNNNININYNKSNNISSNNNNNIIIKSNVSKQHNQQLINATTKTPVPSSSTMITSATEVFVGSEKQNGVQFSPADTGVIISQEQCRLPNLGESSSLIKIKREQVDELTRSSNQSVEKTSQEKTTTPNKDEYHVDLIDHPAKQSRSKLDDNNDVSHPSLQLPTSPKVTVILPRHAASRLRELVQNQDLSLLRLGILSVQFENDQIIKLPSNEQSRQGPTSVMTTMDNNNLSVRGSVAMDLGCENNTISASDNKAPMMAGPSVSTASAIKRPREICNDNIAQSKSTIGNIESPPQKFKRLDVPESKFSDDNTSSSASNQQTSCNDNLCTKTTNSSRTIPARDFTNSQGDEQINNRSSTSQQRPKGPSGNELTGKLQSPPQKSLHYSIGEPSQQQQQLITTTKPSAATMTIEIKDNENKRIMSTTDSNSKMQQKTALNAAGPAMPTKERKLDFRLINDPNRALDDQMMEVDEVLLVRHDHQFSSEEDKERQKKPTTISNYQNQSGEPRTKHLSQQQNQEAIIAQQQDEILLNDDDDDGGDSDTVYHDADEANMIISKPAANIVVGGDEDDALVEPDYCAGLSAGNANATKAGTGVNSGILSMTGKSKSKSKSNLASATASSKTKNTLTATIARMSKQTQSSTINRTVATPATKGTVTNNHLQPSISITKQSATTTTTTTTTAKTKATKGLIESILIPANNSSRNNNNSNPNAASKQSRPAQPESLCNDTNQSSHNVGISIVREGDARAATMRGEMLLVQDDCDEFIVGSRATTAANHNQNNSNNNNTNNNSNNTNDDDYEEMDDKDENEVANEVENQHGRSGPGSGYNIHQLSQLDFTDPIDMESMYADSDNILFPDYTLNLS